MKLDNQTHWRSDQILALARRVAEDELDPEKRKHYTVRVRYGGRGAATSGHARIGGCSCQVNLGSDAVDVVNLAHTLAHEMAHSRGVEHPAMRGSRRYRYVEGWREFYAWAQAFPIERKAPPAKPTPAARQDARLAHARAMLAAWERRAKRAAGRIRKWRTRVRALERRARLAAHGTPPVP